MRPQEAVNEKFRVHETPNMCYGCKHAYNDVVCSLPLDDKTSFYYAFPSKKRAELESNGKVIRKIKVTFSVTVEPA